MKKKLIALLLIITICLTALCLVACDKKETEDTPGGTATNTDPSGGGENNGSTLPAVTPVTIQSLSVVLNPRGNFTLTVTDDEEENWTGCYFSTASAVYFYDDYDYDDERASMKEKIGYCVYNGEERSFYKKDSDAEPGWSLDQTEGSDPLDYIIDSEFHPIFQSTNYVVQEGGVYLYQGEGAQDDLILQGYSITARVQNNTIVIEITNQPDKLVCTVSNIGTTVIRATDLPAGEQGDNPAEGSSIDKIAGLSCLTDEGANYTLTKDNPNRNEGYIFKNTSTSLYMMNYEGNFEDIGYGKRVDGERILYTKTDDGWSRMTASESWSGFLAVMGIMPSSFQAAFDPSRYRQVEDHYEYVGTAIKNGNGQSYSVIVRVVDSVMQGRWIGIDFMIAGSVDVSYSIYDVGSTVIVFPEDYPTEEDSEEEDPPEPEEIISEEEAAAFADLRIGLICLHDESSTYDLTFIQGIQEVARKLRLRNDQVVIKTGIPEAYECYSTALDLVNMGCDIIIADSFGHEPSLVQAARENPNVQFCHATGLEAHTEILANYHNFYASIYEGRYLAGVAAGMKLNEMNEGLPANSRNYKIGYVGAYTYAEVISQYTAFYLGAKSVCPDVTMDVRFTGSWYDLAGEREAAQELIERGCALISQHADSMGAPSACESAGVPNVCYNAGTIQICPYTSLICCGIDWAPYFEYVLRAVANGSAIATDWVGTLADGSVWVKDLGINAASGTSEKLEEVTEQLLNGSIRVFDIDTFTVNGEKLTAYYADVDEDPNYTPDTQVIEEGEFRESYYRSAPYFDVAIDGICMLNAMF